MSQNICRALTKYNTKQNNVDFSTDSHMGRSYMCIRLVHCCLRPCIPAFELIIILFYIFSLYLTLVLRSDFSKHISESLRIINTEGHITLIAMDVFFPLIPQLVPTIDVWPHYDFITWARPRRLRNYHFLCKV